MDFLEFSGAQQLEIPHFFIYKRSKTKNFLNYFVEISLNSKSKGGMLGKVSSRNLEFLKFYSIYSNPLIFMSLKPDIIKAQTGQDCIKSVHPRNFNHLDRSAKYFLLRVQID